MAGVDVAAILEHLRALSGVDILFTPDTHYIYYDPGRDIARDKTQPFATLVLSNAHDTASALGRPGVFRLNLGVGRERYRALFGPEPAWGHGGGPVATGHDFSLLDTLQPHPIYAPMSWICILSPSDASWPRVKALIDEAHAEARRAHERRAA